MTAGTEPQATPGDEALFGAVLAASSEAFVLADDHGRITEWNPAAERTFGFCRAEVLGRSLAETIIPPDLRAAHQLGMERFVRTGEARVIGKRLELHACHKSGREFPVELTISAVQVAGGRWRFAALLHDISERRAAEAGLRQLAAIVDTVDAGIVVLGLDGRIASWNPGAEQMLGHAPPAVVGEPFSVLFAAGGEGQAEGFVARALAGETVRSDTTFVTAAQAPIPVAVSATALVDAEDPAAVAGVSVLFRDITRHKVAEQRLAAFARRQRELARRDDLTGLFNLRALHEGLVAALARATGERRALSLVHFDLGGLRGFDDGEAGDDALRAFGRLLLDHAEAAGGWAARITGAEFALVLPDADRVDARRAGVAVAAACDDAGIGTQAAFGVASSSTGARSPEALLQAAERDLISRRAAR